MVSSSTGDHWLATCRRVDKPEAEWIDKSVPQRVAVKGDDVYRKLMDIDLILQDISKMIPLKMFLGSIRENHPSLIELNKEIETFKGRLEQLIKATQGK